LEGSLGAHLDRARRQHDRRRANDLGAGAVEVRLWYIELGDFSVTGPSFRLGPCFSSLAGLYKEEARYPSSSSASLPWFALGGLRAEAGVGSDLRLGVRAVGLVPTRKHSFSIGYVGTAHESSPVAGVAELILAVKFW
jgi:hypothetical protein